MYLLSNAETRNDFKKSERRVKYIFLGTVAVIWIINVVFESYVFAVYVNSSIFKAQIIENEIRVSIESILMIISGITLLYYLKKFYHYEY